MKREVYTVDLSPRENTHVTPPSPWWFVLQVLVLGVVGYVILVLIMVG